MTIVLPSVAEFAAVQAKLSASWLDEVRTGMAPQTLSVSLPKFTIHPPTYSLKAGLRALGMETAFTAAADFSGITTQESLLIDDVLGAVRKLLKRRGRRCAPPARREER